MLRAFDLSRGGVAPAADVAGAVWVDLLDPTPEERAEAAALIGLEPPTRAEQQEIELSSRLYIENDAAVMTALLPAHTDTEQAAMGPVTFILTPERLVTLRHHDPRPFTTFPQRAARAALPCDSAVTVMLGLVEDVIGRLADLCEYASRKIEQLTRQVFHPPKHGRPDLRNRLYKIGWRDSLVTHVRDSLVTLERLLGFLAPQLEKWGEDKVVRDLLATLQRDAHNISEQAGFLIQKTAFLLDAMMGFINIEQSAINKIFSLVAVVFLPPTLVASIYGMNFEVMPELSWVFGYPTALLLMIGSAALSLYYFRRKGWF